MPVGRFLVGIAALIYDPESEKYLLLRRSAAKDVGAGAWECPTGRVDQGESLELALIREVREELGVAARPQFILGTTRFYRGKPVPENELISVLYACEIEDPGAIVTGEEHDAVRWLTRVELEDFLPPKHWLRWVVDRAEQMRQGVSQELQAVFLEEGFERGLLESTM